MKVCLAIDLGAATGRVIAGRFDGQHLALEELYRFSNIPITENGGLHWDMERLFAHIKIGIAKAAQRFGSQLASIGVDTWGVDYALIDEQGKLLGKPFHYRDRRTDGVQEKVLDLLGRDAIYRSTGIQFYPFNTIYQLVAEKDRPCSNLCRAESLLFIPDLINYWLTGCKVSELTNASTSQFYDPREKKWATPVLEALGLATDILCEIAQPGTRLGLLLENLANETGAGPVEIILPGTHDTASAIAAIPAAQGNWAYLSSGTWSLMGVETSNPIITPKTRDLGLSNEMGVCGTVCLLKIIAGLWLVQQCRSTWESQGESWSYDDITRMASAARPFTALINPDDDMFVPAGDMPARITAYCQKTSQRTPASKGALLRTIFESLALRYRTVLASLEDALGHTIDVLHVVGGGSQNELLNQFTANALNREVIAGPVEATAVGNILMQLLAVGEIDSLQAGRDVVRQSFKLNAYHPADTARWHRAYEQFRTLAAS